MSATFNKTWAPGQHPVLNSTTNVNNKHHLHAILFQVTLKGAYASLHLLVTVSVYQIMFCCTAFYCTTAKLLSQLQVCKYHRYCCVWYLELCCIKKPIFNKFRLPSRPDCCQCQYSCPLYKHTDPCRTSVKMLYLEKHSLCTIIQDLSVSQFSRSDNCTCTDMKQLFPY